MPLTFSSQYSCMPSARGTNIDLHHTSVGLNVLKIVSGKEIKMTGYEIQ